jgi:hypothetical protein
MNEAIAGRFGAVCASSRLLRGHLASLEHPERAVAFLKHKLRDWVVTYAELAQRLKSMGSRPKRKPHE